MTDDRAADRELQETRRYLHLALHSAGLGTWDLDLRTGVTQWDGRTREVLGRPGHGGVSQEEATATIHPDDRAAALATFERTLAAGPDATYEIEKRIVRPDGTVRWTVWTALLECAPDGTPRRLVGTVRDVTEVREAREQLRKSEEQFRLMASALPQIVWTARADGVVDFYNDRWREFSGLSEESGYGEGWKVVVHPDDEAATIDAWQHAVARGEPYDVEHRIRRADGEFRWMLSRGVPLLDELGQVVRWFGTATDIHERKQAESELRAARDEAEAASRAKSQFLAVMSHELRTPLTAVIGFSELLESGVLGSVDEQQRLPLKRISASAWGLVRIIDEILTLSRAEAGREQLRLEATDLADIARDATALLQPEAKARGLQLVLEQSDGDGALFSDSGKIRQILINLIGNAIKFTDHGSVTVQVCTNGGDRMEVHVRDTGPGVPIDQMELIFEPFTQVDQTTTREKGGTGLGLTVSRRLARLLGGDVTVESSNGIGSTFTLWLPRLAPAQAAAPEEIGTADGGA